jgi:hypothetical protein
MDPNQWRNFNLPYGQSPPVGLGSGPPRLEMGPQQTGFTSGAQVLSQTLCNLDVISVELSDQVL